MQGSAAAVGGTWRYNARKVSQNATTPELSATLTIGFSPWEEVLSSHSSGAWGMDRQRERQHSVEPTNLRHKGQSFATMRLADFMDNMIGWLSYKSSSS